MSSPHPDGSLFLLPREVRDRIFGDILSKVYLAHGEVSGNNLLDSMSGTYNYTDHLLVFDLILTWDCPTEAPYTPADLAILRASKTIKNEAEDVLFKTGTFRFAIDPCEPQKNSRAVIASVPSQERLNRMRHIEIVLDIGARYDKPVRTRSLHQTILPSFTGTEAPAREYCRIKLRLRAYTSLTKEIIPTDLFQVFKHYVGFKVLTLEVEAVYEYQTEWNKENGRLEFSSPSWEQMDCTNMLKSLPDNIFRRLDWGIEETMLLVKQELEPDLGPSVEEEVPEAPVNITYAGHIRFQPREYHAAKLAAKAAELKM